MATFGKTVWTGHDDYMTPKSAWEDIQQFIPRDKIIWEAFYGDGKSGTYLRELGFDTIHEPVDFFENNLGEIVVSNPPFKKIPQILSRLKELGKPFILIMPSSKINTQFFYNIFGGNDDLQIIIPRKRIAFGKMINGETQNANSPPFDCFYYCWKIGLERDINWL